MSSTSNVDEKLAQILDIIKNSIEGKNSSPTPKKDEYPPTVDTKTIGDTAKFQKMVANECMYNQLLVPVTPAIAQEAEKKLANALRL
jgi:hypothetical protein